MNLGDDYDGYGNEDYGETYPVDGVEDDEHMPSDAFSELSLCAEYVLGEWFNITAHIILSSCLLRCLGSSGRIPRWAVHCTSTVLRFHCMVGIMDWHAIYASTFAMLGITTLYFVEWTVQARRTLFVTVACLSMIIGVGEFKLFPSQWNRIRGSVMIMSMKLISLAMDMDDGRITRYPPLIPVLGYMFHSATVIFGPWVSFDDYFLSIEHELPRSDMKADLLDQGWVKWCGPRAKSRPAGTAAGAKKTDRGHSGQRSGRRLPIAVLDPLWLLSLLRTLFLSTIFLVASSCGVDWFPETVTNRWVWLGAYFHALSFRMSHYFVSFHSESSAAAAGIRSQDRLNQWNLHIVRPEQIELPRSLVEVVVFWNRPMHIWLKTYVFKRIISRGRLVAVLATFAASSILHGLSIRINAVLLSLGFYTYIEFSLRAKLSSVLNACLGARKCRSCPHVHKNTAPVKIMNSLFSLLAIFHLAYLGTLFAAQRDDEDAASLEHTLREWSNLGFASHIVAAAMFLLYLIM